MPQHWPTGETGLYATVTKYLPAYRTKRGKLDVPRLSDELGKSEEAIYRWFRQDDLLRVGNARDIIRLANGDDNLIALAAATQKPPTLDDLIHFVR
jgi:hypothetical protein